MKHVLATLLCAIGAVSLPVQADINVGVIVGATGPGASLGIPYKNAFSLLPATMAFAQEHGDEAPSSSTSPHWSDVKEVAVWSIAGVAAGAVILGVLYTLKRKVGGFPANPSWVAPITIMPSSGLPQDDGAGHGHDAPDAHGSHAPAH